MSNIPLYFVGMFLLAPYWGEYIAANPAGKRFHAFNYEVYGRYRGLEVSFVAPNEKNWLHIGSEEHFVVLKRNASPIENEEIELYVVKPDKKI